MKSQQFEEPQLFVVKARELSLSGLTLLELMRAVLSRGAPFRFSARGWSMAPFIQDGDVVTVSPLRAGPGIGEVVAFVHPQMGMLVVHRIVAKCDGFLFIQADNPADHSEEPVPVKNLLGRVTQVERDGQRVWLGLGPERFVIAWLSRAGLLVPIRDWLVSILRN